MTVLGQPPVVDLGYQPVPTILGISPHGLFAAVGIAAGYWLIIRGVRRRGLDSAPVERAIVWGVMAGIVGARADYVISHPGAFSSVLQMLQLWKGGLALFGGLIAGTAAAILSLRRSRQPLPVVLDAAAVGLPLAIAIGRVGDLLLTDHLGAPTTSALAIAYRVPAGAHLAPGFGVAPAAPPGPGQSCAQVGTYFAGCSYHLTAAYDLLGALALFGFLWLLTRRPHPPGAVFAVFVGAYAAQRLVLDVTRGVDERPLWGMTGTQLLSVALVAGATVALARLYQRRGRRPSQTAGATGDGPGSPTGDGSPGAVGSPERPLEGESASRVAGPDSGPGAGQRWDRTSGPAWGRAGGRREARPDPRG